MQLLYQPPETLTACNVRGRLASHRHVVSKQLKLLGSDRRSQVLEIVLIVIKSLAGFAIGQSVVQRAPSSAVDSWWHTMNSAVIFTIG